MLYRIVYLGSVVGPEGNDNVQWEFKDLYHFFFRIPKQYLTEII